MAQLQPLPLLAACIRDSQAMPQARPVSARGYPSHTLCRSVLAMSPSINETDSQRELIRNSISRRSVWGELPQVVRVQPRCFPPPCGYRTCRCNGHSATTKFLQSGNACQVGRGVRSAGAGGGSPAPALSEFRTASAFDSEGVYDPG